MRRLVWIVACVILPGCGPTTPPPPDDPGLEMLLLESSSVGDFRSAEGPTVHTPETLWEYLDGGAPRYLAYGLVRMVHVRYQLGDDPLASVTADLYEMGSELGAFGIYTTIRPPDLDLRPWGAEGYRSGTVAAAWKGTVFVHAVADDDRTELIEMAEMLVEQICDRITAETSAPAILHPLPPDGLVPHSERYVAADLFGHAALPGGVLATYEIESRRGELFFSDLENEIAAKDALVAFRREKERWAEVADTATGFRFEDPGADSGTVVVAGRFVAGVHGDLTLEDREELLTRLIDRLGS